MWGILQAFKSLVSPQSEAEKAASLEERYFEDEKERQQQQQRQQERQRLGMPDAQDSEGASSSSAAVRSSPASSSGGTAGALNGERAMQKVKGYFALAKEEIEKGVRSEEWGLTADAVAHYKNANRILVEGMAARLDVEPGR